MKYFGTENKPHMSDFEYAAFSAIWGSVYLFIAILITEQYLHWPSENDFNNFLGTPFVLTPVVGAIGLLIGIVLAYSLHVYRILKKIWKK